MFICNYCKRETPVVLNSLGACLSCAETIEEISELFYGEDENITSMDFLDILGE